MDRILLERLGIGWNDTVAEANEKRMKDELRLGTNPVGAIPQGLPNYVQWKEPLLPRSTGHLFGWVKPNHG